MRDISAPVPTNKSNVPRSFLKEVFSGEDGWGSFSRITLAYFIPASLLIIGVDIVWFYVPKVIYNYLVTIAVALIASSARYELQGTLTGLASVLGGWRGNRSDTPSQSVTVSQDTPNMKEGEH